MVNGRKILKRTWERRAMQQNSGDRKMLNGMQKALRLGGVVGVRVILNSSGVVAGVTLPCCRISYRNLSWVLYRIHRRQRRARIHSGVWTTIFLFPLFFLISLLYLHPHGLSVPSEQGQQKAWPRSPCKSVCFCFYFS